MIHLANDTAILTAAGGSVELRPTVFAWQSARVEATHVRLSGALPAELAGIFPIARREGERIFLTHADRKLESKRPVGCTVEFLRAT